MRKLFLMLLLVSGLANAAAFRSDKPTVCGEVDEVFASLQGAPYDELPLWMGKDLHDGTDYVMMVNNKTGSWTFIQLNDRVACVLGTGKGHTLVTTNMGEAT